MLHTIRKVARTIHRRSVWQVLAVYVLAGWVGLEGVRAATTRLGLPGWTPTLALALLAAFLPVVLATALVQGGLPGLRIQDVADPNELPGLTPDQVLVVPQAHPLYGFGLLTWRNSVVVGVSALALLLTSVVAYLTMWALGIGPVGSLLAQGRIQEGDPVTVVAFRNRTDDMRLGPWATAALQEELAQSRLVTVGPVGGDEDEEERPPRASVEGEVFRSGGGYAITLAIVLDAERAPVARYRAEARSRADLVHALDLLAERVRSKFGESLREIRAETPLAELVAPPPNGNSG